MEGEDPQSTVKSANQGSPSTSQASRSLYVKEQTASLVDIQYSESDCEHVCAYCGCTVYDEREVCLGIDIPMTNLGLTSAELLLLFW